MMRLCHAGMIWACRDHNVMLGWCECDEIIMSCWDGPGVMRSQCHAGMAWA